MTDILLTYRVPENDAATVINTLSDIGELVKLEAGGRIIPTDQPPPPPSKGSIKRHGGSKKGVPKPKRHGTWNSKTAVLVTIPANWHEGLYTKSNRYKLVHAITKRYGRKNQNRPLHYGTLQDLERKMTKVKNASIVSWMKAQGWLQAA